MGRIATLILIACACEPGPSAPADAPSEPTSADVPPRAEPSPPAGEPLLVVTDPAVLDRLEAAGLTVGRTAFGGGTDVVGTFADGPRFASLREVLEQDLAGIRASDKKAGVGLRHPHRLFDTGWFDSADTRFELVAVVNRLDRRPFSRRHCGETRLIYRLAYTTEIAEKKVDSRLPMTINVVFWQKPDERAGMERGACAEVARRWVVADHTPKDQLAEHLLAGPLAPKRIDDRHLDAVEVDVQTVRWPAVVHPSLGGHAEYALRVFRLDDTRLVPRPLENTPDVDRLTRDEGERAALLAFLRAPDQRNALEDGTFVIPERFLATKATSVTPLGLARTANRPFSRLFTPEDFADLSFENATHVRSAKGLLRRLDESSCQGCHETRSVAGFHLLGEPTDAAAVLDTLVVPFSPHFDGDLARREAYLRHILAGEEGEEARPLSDHDRTPGAYGSHCGRGDASFAAYACTAGLECVDLGDPDFGACLPPERTAGDPCELGTLRTRPAAHMDRVVDMTRTPCEGDAVCNETAVGFPGGMCTPGCDELGSGEACGVIVTLQTFNNCVARRRPFPECIEKAAFPAGMRACDANTPCRDDYVCARSPHSSKGACLPPYFLFQLRVDGHVLAR